MTITENVAIRSGDGGFLVPPGMVDEILFHFACPGVASTEYADLTDWRSRLYRWLGKMTGDSMWTAISIEAWDSEPFAAWKKKQEFSTAVKECSCKPVSIRDALLYFRIVRRRRWHSWLWTSRLTGWYFRWRYDR